jgi:hypothetical protein
MDFPLEILSRLKPLGSDLSQNRGKPAPPTFYLGSFDTNNLYYVQKCLKFWKEKKSRLAIFYFFNKKLKENTENFKNIPIVKMKISKLINYFDRHVLRWQGTTTSRVVAILNVSLWNCHQRYFHERCHLTTRRNVSWCFTKKEGHQCFKSRLEKLTCWHPCFWSLLMGTSIDWNVPPKRFYVQRRRVRRERERERERVSLWVSYSGVCQKSLKL